MEYSNTVKNKFSKFLNLTFKDKAKTVIYVLTFHLFIIGFRIFGYKKTRYIVDKIISPINCNVSNSKKFLGNESKIIGYSVGNSLFKSTCLEKSLFTYLIVGMYGIKTELKFGVNNSTEDFSSHAWVEYQGIILNDTPETLDNISPF